MFILLLTKAKKKQELPFPFKKDIKRCPVVFSPFNFVVKFILLLLRGWFYIIYLVSFLGRKKGFQLLSSNAFGLCLWGKNTTEVF